MLVGFGVVVIVGAIVGVIMAITKPVSSSNDNDLIGGSTITPLYVCQVLPDINNHESCYQIMPVTQTCAPSFLNLEVSNFGTLDAESLSTFQSMDLFTDYSQAPNLGVGLGSSPQVGDFVLMFKGSTTNNNLIMAAHSILASNQTAMGNFKNDYVFLWFKNQAESQGLWVGFLYWGSPENPNPPQSGTRVLLDYSNPIARASDTNQILITSKVAIDQAMGLPDLNNYNEIVDVCQGIDFGTSSFLPSI